ncbi:lipoprotein [Glaciecola sp. 33A]|jgi:predicted small lipoprotein YifL|uniref:LPS translocon maturation chaperone LptM n=1 Tax=Glaciecola sp. 33A TaxID=2057807 RepID=UPI001E468C86|nr:lipoprotein [Glaciecola sp. 33A]
MSMNRMSKLALCTVLTLFLSACGQRGALFLPEQAPSNKETPEAPAENPEKLTTEEGQ